MVKTNKSIHIHKFIYIQFEYIFIYIDNKA
jgi:hypothetical protein